VVVTLRLRRHGKGKGVAHREFEDVKDTRDEEERRPNESGHLNPY
jgi:hypothetical protein